ncbi:MAG TPA: hypothetical protein VMU94_01685 [Streptosporangiaceae bacterium]|nr:hypothetical protein [Streptosporangiaceae bacterium]
MSIGIEAERDLDPVGTPEQAHAPICAAGGAYTDGSNNTQAFVVSQT